MPYIDSLIKMSSLRTSKYNEPQKPDHEQHILEHTRNPYKGKGKLVGMPDLDLDILMGLIIHDKSGTYIEMMRDTLVMAKIGLGEDLEKEKTKIENEYKKDLDIYHRRMKIYLEQENAIKEQTSLEELKDNMINILDKMDDPDMPETERTIIGAYICKYWAGDYYSYWQKGKIDEAYQIFLRSEKSLIESFKDDIESYTTRQFRSAGEGIMKLFEEYTK